MQIWIQEKGNSLKLTNKPAFKNGCSPNEGMFYDFTYIKAVLRIRIHMFLGDPDPDPLVKGMDPDPDPSIIIQK